MSNRPIFNVLVPFDGNTTVQMNHAMANTISRFVFEFDDIDTEMYALAEFLRDPGSWHRKNSGIAFSVDIFGSMINMNMNQEMLEMFKSYLSEIDNDNDGNYNILRALMHALNDPIRAYEVYVRKYAERVRRNQPQDIDPKSNNQKARISDRNHAYA